MNRSDGKGVRIFAASVFLLAAIGLAVIRIAGGGGEPDVARMRNDPAPALAGIAGWLNSEPLTLQSLRGNVVLLDFWTYSCINCLRTLPGLRDLRERYRSNGFEIVGVHSPEFDFEKVRSNVAEAVKRLHVTWPVAMDNDMATWRNYHNNAWPHVYLVDRGGRLRYDKIGEGDESQLESHLRGLLAEGGHTLPAPVSIPEPAFTADMTPEIYAGYERGGPSGSLANREGYAEDRARTYSAPDTQTLARASTDGAFYLKGTWVAHAEFLQARSRGKIFLPFVADHVYVVAASDPMTGVQVSLDGHPAVVPGSSNRSSFTVLGSRLYSVVDASSGRHLLELDVEPGFQLYTFTFG